jgi:hypothetical protein
MTPEQTINGPDDLRAVLASLRADVAGGILAQYFDPKSFLGAKCRVDEIPCDGPWGDNLELYFRSPRTGARYRLSVEVYHGRGGVFERIS